MVKKLKAVEPAVHAKSAKSRESGSFDVFSKLSCPACEQTRRD